MGTAGGFAGGGIGPQIAVSPTVLQTGQSLTLKLWSFLPNSQFTFGFSGFGQGNGTISPTGGGDFYFPVNSPAGKYSLVIKGKNPQGLDVAVSAGVTVVDPSSFVTNPSGLVGQGYYTPAGNVGSVTSQLLDTVLFQIKFWNPLKRDMNQVADVVYKAYTAYFMMKGGAGALTGQFAGESWQVQPYEINADIVTIQVKHFGPPSAALDVTASTGVIAIAGVTGGGITKAVEYGFIGALLIMGIFYIASTVMIENATTAQMTAVEQQKQTDAQIIGQIMQSNLPPQDKTSVLNNLYPKGVSTNPDKTTAAADSLLGTVTGIIPIILVLAVLGTVSGFMPSKR